jgi:hypothetical protein
MSTPPATVLAVLDQVAKGGCKQVIEADIRRPHPVCFCCPVLDRMSHKMPKSFSRH